MDNLIYSKILSEPVDYSSIESLFNRFIHNLEINNNLGCLIFLEHKEVFTVGKFSKSKYLNLDKMNGIRIINSSRGGDITYHGPGQLVFYPILSIKDLVIKPRDLVDVILDSLIKTFKNHNLESKKNVIGPGVWIQNHKVASIGLKFDRGFSKHGMSVNFDIDLKKLEGVLACGEKDIDIGNLNEFIKIEKNFFINKYSEIFINELIKKSNYSKKNEISLSADSFESEP